ncbi:hypothetical protein GF342_03930 [Candidatus Woesearchaeota archaeon]|nr:hypothetical protein [Candidatus Woesearchaeota archaeon]
MLHKRGRTQHTAGILFLFIIVLAANAVIAFHGSECTTLRDCPTYCVQNIIYEEPSCVEGYCEYHVRQCPDNEYCYVESYWPTAVYPDQARTIGGQPFLSATEATFACKPKTGTTCGNFRLNEGEECDPPSGLGQSAQCVITLADQEFVDEYYDQKMSYTDSVVLARMQHYGCNDQCKCFAFFCGDEIVSDFHTAPSPKYRDEPWYDEGLEKDIDNEECDPPGTPHPTNPSLRCDAYCQWNEIGQESVPPECHRNEDCAKRFPARCKNELELTIPWCKDSTCTQGIYECDDDQECRNEPEPGCYIRESRPAEEPATETTSAFPQTVEKLQKAMKNNTKFSYRGIELPKGNYQFIITDNAAFVERKYALDITETSLLLTTGPRSTTLVTSSKDAQHVLDLLNEESYFVAATFAQRHFIQNSPRLVDNIEAAITRTLSANLERHQNSILRAQDVRNQELPLASAAIEQTTSFIRTAFTPVLALPDLISNIREQIQLPASLRGTHEII